MDENHVLFRLMLAVKEPRVKRTRVYELPQILFCVLTAMLSGATTFEEMELFTRMRREWIEKWVPLPGVPSYDTFNRVLQLIEAQVLETFLRGVVEWLVQATGMSEKQAPKMPECIAVDGKTSRGSQKAGKAIHLLNAWADNARLVIGQRLVDGKSNELLAVPQLLDSLFLDGCIVTVDALNTQTAVAQKIIDKGADYVLPLKGNHPTHQGVVAAIMNDVATSRAPDFEELDKDHGRLETRRCWVTSDLSLFLEKDKWPSLRTLVRIDRTRCFPDGRETSETALFLSSFPADAPTIANAVRRHRGVENKCHWVLDVVFREDACRARSRNAAQNFSAFRVCLLNILRCHKKLGDSFPCMIMRAALDPSYIETLLNLRQN